MTEIALMLYGELLGDRICGDWEDAVTQAKRALQQAGVLDDDGEPTGHHQPTVTMDEALQVLNLAVKADPAGMQALLATVPTTQELFDDPRLFQMGPKEAPTMGLLGVLASLFGPQTEGPDEGMSLLCAAYIVEEGEEKLSGFTRADGVRPGDLGPAPKRPLQGMIPEWQSERVQLESQPVHNIEPTGDGCPFLHTDVAELFGVPEMPIENLPTVCTCGTAITYAETVVFHEGPKPLDVSNSTVVEEQALYYEDVTPGAWNDPKYGPVREITAAEAIKVAAGAPDAPAVVISTDPGGVAGMAVVVERTGEPHYPRSVGPEGKLCFGCGNIWSLKGGGKVIRGHNVCADCAKVVVDEAETTHAGGDVRERVMASINDFVKKMNDLPVPDGLTELGEEIGRSIGEHTASPGGREELDPVGGDEEADDAPD